VDGPSTPPPPFTTKYFNPIHKPFPIYDTTPKPIVTTRSSHADNNKRLTRHITAKRTFPDHAPNMPKDNNRQRMEAIYDVQSDIVSTISLVGKYTTGNVTQRRTKAGYDFYMKSLQRAKLQCERGVQAARDGQQLSPATIGKYTYYHRLFCDYEDILLQEHDKLSSQIEFAEVHRFRIEGKEIHRRTTNNKAMLTPVSHRKGTPHPTKDTVRTPTPPSSPYSPPSYGTTMMQVTTTKTNCPTPSYDSPQYSPTPTHITVTSSSASDSSVSSSSSDDSSSDDTDDDTSTVTTVA
jgi:hypothetical protein